MSRRWPEALRWGICGALALGFHAAGAAVLLARWNDPTDLAMSAPVILMELAPVAVAPQTEPAELPPDPLESKQQADPAPEKPPEVTEIELMPEPKSEPKSEPEPAPEKSPAKVDVKPEPAPEPEIAILPPPRPIIKPTKKPAEKPVDKPKEAKKKPRQQHASRAGAPSPAERKAARAAAPKPGAAAREINASTNWTSQLVARLERYKRYPTAAQARGERGVVRLAFSVDRNGGVHGARVVHSSGSHLLDRETLLLIERAAPLPPPPAEMSGSQIAVVVPIRYNSR